MVILKVHLWENWSGWWCDAHEIWRSKKILFVRCNCTYITKIKDLRGGRINGWFYPQIQPSNFEHAGMKLPMIMQKKVKVVDAEAWRAMITGNSGILRWGGRWNEPKPIDRAGMVKQWYGDINAAAKKGVTDVVWRLEICPKKRMRRAVRTMKLCLIHRPPVPVISEESAVHLMNNQNVKTHPQLD